MKTIEYMGCEYEVPDWAKFIATDEDGDIYVFEMMPETFEDEVLGYWRKSCSRPTNRAKLVGNYRWNWQKTLVEIEE